MENLTTSTIFTFSVYGATDVGSVRDHNEDDFRIGMDLNANIWKINSDGVIELGPLGCILILSDGMGGTNAGEIASRLAVEYSKEFFNNIVAFPLTDIEARKLLKTCCEEVQLKIAKAIGEDKSLNGMGATLILSYILNNGLYIAWIGDSRAYQYCPDGCVSFDEMDPKNRSKRFRLLTDDHSVVWQRVLESHGQYSPEDARLDPNSNVITRYLSDSAHSATPDIIGPVYLYDDHRLILCSDGLNSMLSDQELEIILESNKDPESTVVELIKAANFNGGHDNITVIVLNIINGHSKQIVNIGNKTVIALSELTKLEEDEIDTEKILNAKNIQQRNRIKYLLYLLTFSIILFLAFKMYYKNNFLVNKELSQPLIDTLMDSGVRAESIEHESKKFITPPIPQSTKSEPTKTNDKVLLQYSVPYKDSLTLKQSDTTMVKNLKLDSIPFNHSSVKPKKIINLTPVYSEIGIKPGNCKSSKKCVSSLRVTKSYENGIWFYISDTKDNKFKRIACNEQSIMEHNELGVGEYLINYCLVKDLNKYDRDSIPMVIQSIQKLK